MKIPKDENVIHCIVTQPTVLLLKITFQKLLLQSVLLGDPAEWGYDFAEGMNLGQGIFPGLFHLYGYGSCGEVGLRVYWARADGENW